MSPSHATLHFQACAPATAPVPDKAPAGRGSVAPLRARPDRHDQARTSLARDRARFAAGQLESAGR